MNQVYIDIPEFNPHEAQKKILENRKRFNVIKCGRRFGKTQMSIELATDILLNNKQYVAYFAPTYKDSYDWWTELKYSIGDLIQHKDEQVKQIRTITGSILDVWSIEDPDSGRGRKYHRAIVDECEKAPKFKQAWTRTIRATLSDFKGDAWFLSTPKFGNTYFKELFKQADGKDNWNASSFTTYDNPYIDRSEVDEAKNQIDDLTFRCEYMAEDVDLVSRPFAYAFDESKHVSPTEYRMEALLYLSFDFNVDPITAIAGQDLHGEIHILKEFRLRNSNIYELCDVIKTTYPKAVFIITGDASGSNRSALSEGNLNYYKVIIDKFGLEAEQVRVPGVNPSIGDSRVITNSIFQHHKTLIDPSCTFLIEDLKYVEMTESGAIDKTKDKHRSHLLDCLRYYHNSYYKHYIQLSILDE